MDFRTRDQSWLSQINEVFKENPNVLLDTNGRDIRECINRLKELLKQRTRIWWNRAFLDRYLTKGLIPRGLRVQVFPSFPIEDETFKNKWEELSATCSKGYMGLLVQANSKTLIELENEIEEIQNKIKKDLSNEALEKLNTDLDKEFQKWEQEICSIKTTKFQRDTNDFSQNRVYKWRRQRSHSFSRSRSGSVSSVASNDELVRERRNGDTSQNYQESTFPRRNRERQATKRKTTSAFQGGKKYKNSLEH
ncbi:uncharacterized protein LOC142657838 [Rhinoderma darwinii]|uniref:uncharacterized protein LOC142657838 n=1 Tax=Rhinoderma darwinii TaxID=43563 RepID=UPI003F6642A9